MSVGIVDILKKVEGDLGVPVSMVRSEVAASGLEIFQYEPRARVKIGDANLVSGMLTRHPDGTVQFLGFYVNDAVLADLPAAHRLIARWLHRSRPARGCCPRAHACSSQATSCSTPAHPPMRRKRLSSA